MIRAFFKLFLQNIMYFVNGLWCAIERNVTKKQIWAKKLKTISANRFLTWSAQISQKVFLG